MPAESATLSVHVPDHTLLRVIGRGSYGEVWLARNVMGTLRAVKIVRRSAFDSDRPWVREFEGIRRCEPVSRAHDGLIDILHMGRNEAEGFFYYVMELADAAGCDGEYTPATLGARLASGKALDVLECLRLAESLAGALAFLHEQGLIHRDVKPSNVLYVGGVPKLGDIGLVAEAGSSRSFVGTEGFVPLEGPGTERADIFALGKVLYEALTGQDRERFPRLPAWWADDAEFDQRVELNEIVLRACEGDPARRYHTAREMLSDTALIASGCSVKKMRGMEKRLQMLRWITASIAAAALLAVGASWLWQQQASRERNLRVRAQDAETSEREARLEALLSQVHSARHDPDSAAVSKALKAATAAAAIRVTPELRDDVIFLLSRHRTVQRDDLEVKITGAFAGFHPASGLVAEIPKLPGDSKDPIDITLHVAGAPEKTRTITVKKPARYLRSLEFSHDGKRLLIAGKFGGGMVMDVASGEILTTYPERGSTGTFLSFCGCAGDKLIRRANAGGFAIYSLPEMWRTDTQPVDWPVREQAPLVEPQHVWPSPDGRFVLLIDEFLTLPGQTPPVVTGAACLAEIETGRIVWKIRGPSEQSAAWSSDGTRIAVRTADRILSLDAATGRVAAAVPERIYSSGTRLAFLDSRDILAYTTWSVSGVCDLSRERMLGPPPRLGECYYDPVKRLAYGFSGGIEWIPSPVMKIFKPAKPRSRTHPVTVSFSPDGEWLIAGNTDTFTWWRINDGDNIQDAVVPADGSSLVLFPDKGRAAVFLTRQGFRKTPWEGRPVVELPEAQPYGGPEGPKESHYCEYAAASSDGKSFAFGLSGYASVHSEGKEPRIFWTGDAATPVSLSPDGNWLSIGGHREPDVRLFDLKASGDANPRIISSGIASFPCFSPRGTWLMCSGVHEHLILDMNSHEVVHRGSKEQNWVISLVDFTNDERLMSLQHTHTGCTIIETGTWREPFHFDSPILEGLGKCILSRNGRYFAAAGTRGEIYVWDLQAIDREMSSLGLGSAGVVKK